MDELPIDVYLLFLHDAFIDKMRQTEAGREYLAKCRRLETTEPDRKRLRAKFGGKTDG